MAKITRDGVTTDLGETITEYSTRVRQEKIIAELEEKASGITWYSKGVIDPDPNITRITGKTRYGTATITYPQDPTILLSQSKSISKLVSVKPTFESFAMGTSMQSPDIRIFDKGFEDPLAQRSFWVPKRKKEEIFILGRSIRGSFEASRIKAMQEEQRKVSVMEPTKPLSVIEAREKEPILVKGFFDPKSKDFLDITDFASNVKRKGSSIYKSVLDTSFKYQEPSQVKRTLKGTALLVGGAGLSFGGGVVSGFTMPFRHPVETIKGFKELIVHPFKSSAQIVKEFARDPFGTAGEFYGLGKGLKTIKKGSPVSLQYESFGKGAGKTFGVELGYDFVGKRAYPVASFVPRFGKKTRPNVDFITKQYFIGEDFVQPKTGVGTEVFKSRIGEIITEPSEMLVEGKVISPELQREFAVKGIESTYELKKVKSKFFTKQDLFEQGTKGLTPKESKALFESIGKQKGKVFGSFASMPQVEPTLRRLIGDIEAKFETTSEPKLAKLTVENLKLLQKISPKSVFKILPEEPFHIEKRIKGQFEKVAEFKGEGIGEGDIAPAYAFGYNLWTSKDFFKVDKTLTAMLRGELKRKTAGSIMVKDRTSLGVAHPGRFKDVPDLFKITESLKKSRLRKSPKAESFLETAEKLGVEYKGGEIVKFEILERKLAEVRAKSLVPSVVSPRVSVVSPSLKSPSVKSPSLSISPSPSVVSPRVSVVSPSLKSPSVKSPSLSISPSPSLKSPSVKSPSVKSPSVKSPSVKSPSLSISPSPSLKSPSVISPSLKSPSVMSPSPSPSIKIPSILPSLLLRDKTILKRKKVKGVETLSYIPDFTAKALGLTIQAKSYAQLLRLLKKQQTGLELFRPGVVI